MDKQELVGLIRHGNRLGESHDILFSLDSDDGNQDVSWFHAKVGGMDWDAVDLAGTVFDSDDEKELDDVVGLWKALVEQLPAGFTASLWHADLNVVQRPIIEVSR